jgi:hypothetical protein
MRWTLSLLLCLSMASAQLFAEQHVVMPAELQQRIKAATDSREEKLARLDRLFVKDEVQRILQTAKLDPKEVRHAAAFLTDDELTRLSDRAGKIERDITAGALNNQQLTYIVIALATAVIVIILVKA